MASTNCSSSPTRILLDEDLSGPLYGLPAIGVDFHRLIAAGLQARKADLPILRRHFELELLSLRAVWNANLSIHTLPAEILLDIFKYLLVPSYQQRYTRAAPRRPWVPLMGVCRHWCALIRNDAEFWSTIDISKGTKSMSWLDLTLRRSRRAPLRVTISRGCDIKAAIPILQQHTDHIKELEVSAPNAGWIKALFIHGLPILANLTVNLDQHVAYGRPRRNVDFVNRNICPRLEELGLLRYGLTWTAPLLANLQFLSLSDCALSTEPLSFTAFLDVLEHGQELRSLQLGSFLFVVLSSQTSVPPGRLVTLPKLSYLGFHALPDIAARLMSHLRILGTCDFELMGECSSTNPSITYASFLPRNAPFVCLTPFVSFVSLQVCREVHVITWNLPPGGTFMLELYRASRARWDHTWLESGLRQLPSLFALRGAGLTHLNIAGALAAVSSATWDMVFDSFPTLEILDFEVQAGSAFPTAIIRSLSVPVTAPGRAARKDGVDGLYGVRCPALADLNFMMDDGWKWTPSAVENVVTCLRARAARGAPQLKCLRVSPRLDIMAGAGLEHIWEGLRQKLRANVELLRES